MRVSVRVKSEGDGRGEGQGVGQGSGEVYSCLLSPPASYQEACGAATTHARPGRRLPFLVPVGSHVQANAGTYLQERGQGWACSCRNSVNLLHGLRGGGAAQRGKEHDTSKQVSLQAAWLDETLVLLTRCARVWLRLAFASRQPMSN